jgi:hypothetical protein
MELHEIVRRDRHGVGCIDTPDTASTYWGTDLHDRVFLNLPVYTEFNGCGTTVLNALVIYQQRRGRGDLFTLSSNIPFLLPAMFLGPHLGNFDHLSQLLWGESCRFIEEPQGRVLQRLPHLLRITAVTQSPAAHENRATWLLNDRAELTIPPVPSNAVRVNP